MRQALRAFHGQDAVIIGSRHPVIRVSWGALVVLALAGCQQRAEPAAVIAPAPPRPAQATAAQATAPAFAGPVLGSDGRCQGTPTGTAAAIEPGIGECDLVRLKGREPTDVLVGESGKGSREVQVLYQEPGGRELYFFVNNRLDRIVR